MLNIQSESAGARVGLLRASLCVEMRLPTTELPFLIIARFLRPSSCWEADGASASQQEQMQA